MKRNFLNKTKEGKCLKFLENLKIFESSKKLKICKKKTLNQ